MKYAIIGLGQFGSALAIELADSGHEVLAIDTDENHLREVRDRVALAAHADGNDPVALEQLGVGDVDAAIVAIGEGFEASLMITAHCQKLGSRRVYTRVINDVQDRLLDLMEVTGKIRAESLAAANFAHRITHETVRRYFEIGGGHAIVEVDLPEGYIGKTLAEAQFRTAWKINVVTVRRPSGVPASGECKTSYEVVGTLDPSFRFGCGDRLVLFGKGQDVERFCDTAI